jgi:hypothetical protein
MKNKRNLNGGYIGLLLLLLGVAFIIFFFFRSDLFSGQKDGKTIIEQDLNALNQAKDAKALIEEKSKKSAEDLTN